MAGAAHVQSLARFVDSIVREEMLFQFMLAGDFAHDPALRGAVKTSVVNHLIKTRVTDKGGDIGL